MNITLTVRGALEDDPALQEIVSILYRKAAEGRGEIKAGAPEADSGEGNTYGPKPRPGVPALSAEDGRDVPVPDGTDLDAVESPGNYVAPKPESEPAKPEPAEPGKPVVARETVRKAASDAINRHKRAEVVAILEAHGGRLADVPPENLADVLAEIEAL